MTASSKEEISKISEDANKQRYSCGLKSDRPAVSLFE